MLAAPVAEETAVDLGSLVPIQQIASSAKLLNAIPDDTKVHIARRAFSYTWNLIKTKVTINNVKAAFRSGGPVHKLAIQSIDCRKFSRPANSSELQSRIWKNCSDFKTLYMLTTLAITVWTVFSSMWLICGIAIIGIGWFYFDTIARVAFKAESTSMMQKVTVMAPLTFIIALITGMISTIIYISLMSFFAAMAHASFHEGAQTTIADATEPVDIEMQPGVLEGDFDVSALEGEELGEKEGHGLGEGDTLSEKEGHGLGEGDVGVSAMEGTELVMEGTGSADELDLESLSDGDL